MLALGLGPVLGQGGRILLEPGPHAAGLGLPLKLGEGGPQQLLGPIPRVVGDEVDGHVVGGAEARTQRVAAGRGDGGHPLERHVWRVQHDGRSFVVDAPPAGPAGQLGVVAGCQELVGLAVELGEALEDAPSGPAC